MITGKRAHFIGIGGIGMSGLARMYLSLGYAVQGSDERKSAMTETLEKMGAKVFIGHDARYIDGSDVVVYSSSIREDHPERREAARKGLRVLHRAEALAGICEGKYTVAVTGTHGKTTTTSLVGMVLKEAGRDPSVVVGGLVDSFGGNAYLGQGPEIVIEADESDSSFLKFSPDLEVITNIEADHMDHFKTMEQAEVAYQKFIGRLSKGGEWLGCSEDPRIRRFASQGARKSLLYGFDPSRSEVYATDVLFCENGDRGMRFKAWHAGECLGPVTLSIIGRHNVLNALAAIGVGLKLGIPFEVIKKALEKYRGAGRRFDVKYEDPDFLVVDDYAHHPTEIKETLAAARGLNKKRIVALFQPHRYTRTEALLGEFGESFFGADKLVITDIYAASESPRPGVTGDRVSRAVRDAGHRDVIFVERPKVLEFLLKEIRPGDLVIALGAGDIYEVAGEVSDFLRKKRKLFSGVRGKVHEREPLSKHTSLRVGGPVDFWVVPEDTEDLKEILRFCGIKEMPVRVFGGGSNILAPDEGLRGVAVHLGAPYFHRMCLEDDRIKVRAGVPNTLFIQYALENGFGGFEFLQGIPGSIGGSIAMNAGSHGQSISTFLESVTVLDKEGREQIFRKGEIHFGYRHSGLGDRIVVEAVFVLPRGDRETVRQTLEEYRIYRLRTQDLQHASAGCMFKNPEGLDRSSGQLIADAGLKGRTVGDAQVSAKHANFIINLGHASSKDVSSLIREVRETVKRKFGVELEPEVKIL